MVLDKVKMLHGFVHGQFWIGECIELRGPKYFCDKPSVKFMVIHARQYVWQTQHEWGESLIHAQIEVIEHNYAMDGFPKFTMVRVQSLQQYIVQISKI